MAEGTTRYIALIYTDETADKDVTPQQQEAVMQEYFAFGERAREAGVYVTGEALHPATTATTVRVRNGERLTTDGPFAETKEQLGGFYMLKAKDLDEAIHWAAQIPGARHGSIEVRPLVEFGA